jgi:hypothetical protein
MSRPSKYTQKLGDSICEAILNEETLREIGKKEGFPSAATILRWVSDNPEFREQYARAMAMRAELMFEELLEIADDGSNDWMEVKKGDYEGWRENGEAIARSRLRVDARKWALSKMLPKKYGDKVELEHSGKVEVEVVIGGDVK